MCMKLIFRDLNFNPYPSHRINTYTYRMTIAIKIHNNTRVTILITLSILDY